MSTWFKIDWNFRNYICFSEFWFFAGVIFLKFYFGQTRVAVYSREWLFRSGTLPISDGFVVLVFLLKIFSITCSHIFWSDIGLTLWQKLLIGGLLSHAGWTLILGLGRSRTISVLRLHHIVFWVVKIKITTDFVTYFFKNRCNALFLCEAALLDCFFY